MIALVLATVVLWLGGAFLGEFHCKLPKLYLSKVLLIYSWSSTESPCPGQSVWGKFDYTTDKPGCLHLVFVGTYQAWAHKKEIEFMDQITSHPSLFTHAHTHTHVVQWHHCAGHGLDFLHLLFIICGALQWRVTPRHKDRECNWSHRCVSCSGGLLGLGGCRNILCTEAAQLECTV